MAGASSLSSQRQPQFPWARPGTFMRASLSRLRYILERRYGQCSPRRPSQSKQCWRDFICGTFAPLKEAPDIAPLVSGQILVPAPGRRIVVSAGIYDCMDRVVLWKERIVFMTIEGKLQNPGARDLKLVAQGHHVRGDYAEILSQEREAAEFLTRCLEKRNPGAWNPLATARVRRPRGDVPGGGEAPEVIEPDHVHVGQQGAQALNAPAKTVPPERLPVVDGIAPELAVGTEEVRGHASDKAGSATLVEQEIAGVRPNVSEVGETKKGRSPIRRMPRSWA